MFFWFNDTPTTWWANPNEAMADGGWRTRHTIQNLPSIIFTGVPHTVWISLRVNYENISTRLPTLRKACSFLGIPLWDTSLRMPILRVKVAKRRGLSVRKPTVSFPHVHHQPRESLNSSMYSLASSVVPITVQEHGDAVQANARWRDNPAWWTRWVYNISDGDPNPNFIEGTTRVIKAKHND